MCVVHATHTHRADSFCLQQWPGMLSLFVIHMFKESPRVNGGHTVQFSYQGLMNFHYKEASRPGLVICWLKCTSTGLHSARHSVFLNKERTSVWVCFAVRMSCVIWPVAVGSRLWPWCIYSFSCFQTVFVCHVRSFAWVSKSLAEKWQWDFLW